MGLTIHIFDTLGDAEAALGAIHAVAAEHFSAIGYTVIRAADSASGWRIISKANGVDDPHGATDCWVTAPTAAPDGRYYVPTPDGLGLIPDWEALLAARGVVMPEAVEIPPEWVVEVGL